MCLSGVIGTRPQESHTILGNVGITPSVECGDVDLMRRGGSSHPTGGTSRQREATVTEIGESILVPDHQALGLLGFLHYLLICGDGFSFRSTKSFVCKAWTKL